jgi:hypothetical protein
VDEGRHAASIALLGNYMAGSFVATADADGGALLTQAGQTGQPAVDASGPIALGGRTREATEVGANGNWASRTTRTRLQLLIVPLSASTSW